MQLFIFICSVVQANSPEMRSVGVVCMLCALFAIAVEAIYVDDDYCRIHPHASGCMNATTLFSCNDMNHTVLTTCIYECSWDVCEDSDPNLRNPAVIFWIMVFVAIAVLFCVYCACLVKQIVVQERKYAQLETE